MFTNGSIINQILSNSPTKPIVGMGATELLYTDRIPYEVISVSEDGKEVVIEKYDAKANPDSDNLQIGHQDWVLYPTGQYITLRKRNGSWRSKSETIEFLDEYLAFVDSLDIGNQERYDNYKKPLFDDNGDLKLVEGKTKKVVSWHKKNIVFGRKEYYYCWEI